MIMMCVPCLKCWKGGMMQGSFATPTWAKAKVESAFCQAQPQLQLQLWLRLVLVSIQGVFGKES